MPSHWVDISRLTAPSRWESKLDCRVVCRVIPSGALNSDLLASELLDDAWSGDNL